jgi:hypothetical protein
MIAATDMDTGQLVVYVTDEIIDDAAVECVKQSNPRAIVLADLLEPLYDSAIPTREAAYTLGRIKYELESMVERGERVAVLCRRHDDNLGTRSLFLASLCNAADRVHFLNRT